VDVFVNVTTNFPLVSSNRAFADNEELDPPNSIGVAQAELPRQPTAKAISKTAGDLPITTFIPPPSAFSYHYHPISQIQAHSNPGAAC
jgi:hypothetical protein